MAKAVKKAARKKRREDVYKRQLQARLAIRSKTAKKSEL